MREGIILNILDNSLIILTKSGKIKKEVEKERIRKLMKWDLIDIDSLKVIRRARVVRVDRCIKLMKFLDDRVFINLFGKVSEDGGKLLGENGEIRLITPVLSLKGKEVVIEGALLKKEGIEITKKSRVFSH